tara:strand:+ start:90 stop:401 length:312 start_codon:yes stop_codon:yes gene_type:complete
MNPITDLIFSLSWIVLFAFAIRSIIKGWSISQDISMQGYSVEKKTVTKIPHPEMTDVKNGDELLVVKFGNENKKDPLLKSLQERIDEIQEDDEDDDGDIIVRI